MSVLILIWCLCVCLNRTIETEAVSQQPASQTDTCQLCSYFGVVRHYQSHLRTYRPHDFTKEPFRDHITHYLQSRHTLLHQYKIHMMTLLTSSLVKQCSCLWSYLSVECLPVLELFPVTANVWLCPPWRSSMDRLHAFDLSMGLSALFSELSPSYLPITQDHRVSITYCLQKSFQTFHFCVKSNRLIKLLFRFIFEEEAHKYEHLWLYVIGDHGFSRLCHDNRNMLYIALIFHVGPD